MNPRLAVGLVAGALFLYWIVQSPIGAAETLRGIVGLSIDLLSLVANRLVAFLDALL